MELLDVMKNLTIKQADDSHQLLRSVAAKINDEHTEIVYAEYSDSIFVIISQYLKIGSMIQVQRDQIHSPLGTNDIFTTKVLFGATGEEQQVAARFLAEALNISKPLCIFINLRSYSIDTVKACRDIIKDLKKDENVSC